MNHYPGITKQWLPSASLQRRQNLNVLSQLNLLHHPECVVKDGIQYSSNLEFACQFSVEILFGFIDIKIYVRMCSHREDSTDDSADVCDEMGEGSWNFSYQDL
jgi:hypothetical protein